MNNIYMPTYGYSYMKRMVNTKTVSNTETIPSVEMEESEKQLYP